MNRLAAFGVLSALTAFAAVGGAVVGCGKEREDCFAVFCGPNYDANTDPNFNYDAGRPPPEQYDATPVPWDPSSGLGCSTRPNWQVVQPFPWVGNCAIQVAPKSELAAAQLPLRPCRNGMAKCTEIALPNQLRSKAPYARVLPGDPESDSFVFDFSGDTQDSACRDTHFVRPVGDTLELRGATASGAICQADVRAANDFLSLGHIDTTTGGISLRDWTTGASTVTSPTPFVAVSPQVSGSTVYMHTELGNLELFDLASGAHLHRPLHDGYLVVGGTARFAAGGDLWVRGMDAEANGKHSLWRVSREGYFPMLQKEGVHSVGAWTDGVTLFWCEADVTTAAPPHTEIWQAPFTKDAATLRATARRVADITGAGNEIMDAVAHGGFYAVPIGKRTILVLRASDGATQRVAIPAGLPGNWSALLPAYVDATQVWFDHGGASAADSGIARVALDPWP